MSLNAEIISQLKAVIGEFLMTDIGKKEAEFSLSLQRDWDQMKKRGTISFRTKDVKLNQLTRRLRSKITKLTIIPIGLNNLCHRNALIFRKCGFTNVLGYNLTSCRCGKYMSFELHSASEKDGVLYDLTRDFNDETEKYFLKIKSGVSAKEIENINEKYVIINKGCRCGCSFRDGIQRSFVDEDVFEEIIEKIEKNEEEEEEIDGVCWECGTEGKFIGKECDEWRCYDCSTC